MKKKYLILQLITIVVFIAIPPLLQKETNHIYSFGINSATFIQLILAVLLNFEFYTIRKNLNKKNDIPENPNSENQKNQKALEDFSHKITVLKYFALTLAFLMLTYAFTLFLTHLPLPILKSHQNTINFPNGPAWIFAFVQLAISAFFEEVIYRELLPESLLLIFPLKNQNFFTQNKKLNFKRLLLEGLPLILFSLAHLYAGLASVINAFFSAIFLRLSYIKTKSVYTGAASHFVYNSLMLLFAYFA